MGQGWFPVLLLLGWMALMNPALAEPNYMLCKRDSYASVVGKTFSNSKNICDASAKIQSIAYECGVPEESYEFKAQSIETNVKAAQRACDEFCEDVDSKCRGRLTESTQCGFSIPVEREMMVGREVIDCPARCRGQAFHYCSIYHGSYFGFDESLFKKAPDNCNCYQKD